MNAILPSRQVLIGYACAVFTFCLGVYFHGRFAAVEEREAGMFLLRLFQLLAVMALLKATFQWGRSRGFPVRSEDGRLLFDNLLSNLVMAGLVIIVLVLVCSPLIVAAVRLGH